MNVEQLMEVLGVNESDLSPSSSEFEMQGDTGDIFVPNKLKRGFEQF